MSLKASKLSSSKIFGGYTERYKHDSAVLGCSMTFTIFFPPSPSPSHKFPILYFLAGLAADDTDFFLKAGGQRAAASEGLALVSMDTSPRGLNVEGEADSWDLGLSAGFYLNATQDKWKNWQMYDYVVKEFPKVLSENFEQLDTSRASIFGHSMGGHGSLIIYLRNPDKYKSASAIAPITNPVNCQFGKKAFSNYLGDNTADWEEYDATILASKGNDLLSTILIDQGDDDQYIDDQLLPFNFEKACKSANVPLLLRIQPGYDHSYNTVATFVDDHIHFHVKALNR